MQYLVSVIDDRTNSGTPEESRAIDEFNERLRAGGYWVFAAGLAAPSTATVIDGRSEACNRWVEVQLLLVEEA
jgi:hypothetical protein